MYYDYTAYGVAYDALTSVPPLQLCLINGQLKGADSTNRTFFSTDPSQQGATGPFTAYIQVRGAVTG